MSLYVSYFSIIYLAMHLRRYEYWRISISLTWFTNHLKLVFWWINIFCRCLCFHHHNNILFVNCPVAKHFGICVKEIWRKRFFVQFSISINIYYFFYTICVNKEHTKLSSIVLKFSHLKYLNKKTIFLPFPKYKYKE